MFIDGCMNLRSILQAYHNQKETAMATTNTENKSKLADQLRHLADVIELDDLQFYCTSVREDGTVTIIESDFRKLFKGQKIVGKRENSLVDASADYLGITFRSYLYCPVDRDCGEVTIQI